MEGKDNLKVFNRNEQEYGPLYREHLFEQYKLYLTGVDNLVNKRHKTNDFFLAINTGILALLGVVSRVFQDNLHAIFFISSGVGIFLAYIWYRLIKSYKKINKFRYKILHNIEEELPLSPHRAEWNHLDNEIKRKKYVPVTRIETFVPLIFIGFYILLGGFIYWNQIITFCIGF